MRIIAHRGNIYGPEEQENSPRFIDRGIELGFDCEIDLWLHGNTFLLGHDFGRYQINLNWLRDRECYLWVHCKNLLALHFLSNLNNHKLNFFWHENDKYSITSSNKIWTYPGASLMPGSVAVLPELWSNDEEIHELSECFAICTDYSDKYKKILISL